MFKAMLLPFLLLFATLLTAQTARDYRPSIGFITFGTTITGYGVSNELKTIPWPKPLTEEQLLQAEMEGVQPNFFGIDKIPETPRWDLNVQHQSDKILYGSIAAGLVFTVAQGPNSDFVPVMAQLESILATYGFTKLVKPLIHRKRPYAYHDKAPLDERKDYNARLSMWSAHTAAAWASGASTYQIFLMRNPNMDFTGKAVAGVSILAIPTVAALLRIKGGNHFITDVIVGALVGSTVGVLVPRLHRVNFQ